jgi:hypothetical protein
LNRLHQSLLALLGVSSVMFKSHKLFLNVYHQLGLLQPLV